MNTCGAPEMQSDFWSRTVTIEISSHEKAKINNVRQAAEFLLKSWHGPKDDLYKQAVIQCTHAIKGEAPADAALLHFLVAAKQSKARIELSEDWSKPDEFVSGLWRECENILRTSIDERSTDT